MPRPGPRPTPSGRPKVLLSAYACRPKGGSEPGAGWAWAKAAARDHDVWVITRGKFAHELDEELADRPVPGLTVVPLELPRWLLKLRRRHADVYWYYPLWQRLAGRVAARLHAEHSFDVIHHLTFAVDWMPAGAVRRSYATSPAHTPRPARSSDPVHATNPAGTSEAASADMPGPALSSGRAHALNPAGTPAPAHTPAAIHPHAPAPAPVSVPASAPRATATAVPAQEERSVRVIWGPVGGSTPVPLSMAHWLGVRGVIGELVRRAYTGVCRRLVGRRLASSADLVVAQNPDVAEVFRPCAREVAIQPNVAISRFAHASGPREPFGPPGVRTALFVGRLIPWKGVLLAISALARPEAAGWELRIVGDGPDWRRAERLAERLGIRDRIEFAGQLPREEVLTALLRADALLAPAMREAAGWAVTEALASGCPVICLDRGGPSVIVGPHEGTRVPWQGDIPGALAQALAATSTRITPVSRWGPERLPDLLTTWYQQTRVTT